MSNIKYFKRWNWEADVGEDSLQDVQSLPKSHCQVMYNHDGHVYRVISYNSDDLIVIGSDDEDKSVYDYYCDKDGNILEKRSLDDEGNVVLIVQYEYKDGKRITETAWSPTSEEAPNKVTI